LASHDPGKVLETLRNHLTHVESNVAFLFGAGTSCAVRVPFEEGGERKERSLIPNVAELTSICDKEIAKLDRDSASPRFAPAMAMLEKEVKPVSRATNIEDILSAVRRKIEAMGQADTLCGLSLQDLETVDMTIRRTIAAQVNPDSSNFPERLPHEDFVRWIARVPRPQPVEVFTTNYDILIETALEAERVPSFDGFVGSNIPFFLHESLTRPEATPGPAWVRLWKVHGSINWQIKIVNGRKRVVRTAPQSGGEMIMPSHHKYDESRKQPYMALLDRLRRVMERDDTILFVCGYSFSDDHINAILFDALEARQRPHIVALQYFDPDPKHVLAERALQLRNLMILGPNRATIRGSHGAWSSGNSTSFAPLDGAFEVSDKDAAPKFLLGDFSKFSGFLASLATQN
jgi:SIR2-like domain